MHCTTLLVAAIAALALSPACSRAPEPAVASELPESFWLASPPEDAQDVILARVMATDGAELLVKGRVGELSDQRAQLELMDTSFTPCDERPGDTCKTPWDYCCATPEELQPHRATIKVTDEQDKTLKLCLKGQGEIEELKTLVVKGVVAVGSDNRNLIINAQCIFQE